MQARYDATVRRRCGRPVARAPNSAPSRQEVLEACFVAANQVFDEKSAESENFPGIYDVWKDFRSEQVSWFGVTELSFDTLMTAESAAGRL